MKERNHKNVLLGESIKKQRLSLDLTQAELADRLFISESALRSYELGDRRPNQKQIEEIARGLRISPYSLNTYGVETVNEFLGILQLMEDLLGLKPQLDGSVKFGNASIRDAIASWALLKFRLNKGSVSQDEYDSLMRSFANWY